MTDEKLSQDEARRTSDYENIKAAVGTDVGSEIASQATRIPDSAPRKIAEDMHSHAVDEVVQTHQEVKRGRILARVSQVVDYIFFVIYGLLAVRLMLELFAARESVGFFKFIKTLTGPIYAPFQGLVPNLSTPDGFSLELSIIVALFVYALLHAAINGLLRLGAHRKVEI